MSLARSDQPRTNRDPSEIDRKLGLLAAPHMTDLSHFVRKLRAERGDDSIPWFDPTEAGIHASIMMLFEAPGRRAAAGQGSGFVSADNNDGSAANMWHFLREAGVNRSEEIIAWNIVPWYLGTETQIRAATKSDIRQARPALVELLALLADLQVVVLFGKHAADGWAAIDIDIPTVTAPHPSPRNLNGRPRSRALISHALMQARYMAGLSDQRPASPSADDPRPSTSRASRTKAVWTPPQARKTPGASRQTSQRDSSPSRTMINTLFLDGTTVETFVANPSPLSRRARFLKEIEEEARKEGELAAFEPTGESVAMLRETRNLRWEAIAARITGHARQVTLAKQLYDQARGPGAARRSYTGRGRRFAEME